MNISKINMFNFRCFHDTSIKFNKELSVIVGNNGAGKSTIIDAVSIALGSYLAGIDGVPSNSIDKDSDVRIVSYEVGSVIDRQPQFPVIIKCEGYINDKKISWERRLNSESGRTTIVDAKPIMNLASRLQQRLRKGEQETTVLPLVSYYGTGRLWAHKSFKHATNDFMQQQNNTRISGYIDCLDAKSSDKLMLQWFEKMTMIELQEKHDLPELRAVINAVKKGMTNILSDNESATDIDLFYELKTNDIVVTYKDSHGEVHKHPMKELSDGYRNTFSMIADIAYRMAVLNPQLLGDVNSTPGIVLIDEIDQHLHPSWQKRIIKDLRSIFPFIQFIVTTHAPSVIGSIDNKHLILLHNNEVYYPSSTTYGRDVNSVLREIMGVSERQQEVLDKFNLFYSYVDEQKYDQAKKMLNNLTAMIGSEDPEIARANVTLKLETL